MSVLQYILTLLILQFNNPSYFSYLNECQIMQVPILTQTGSQVQYVQSYDMPSLKGTKVHLAPSRCVNYE